MGLRVVKNTFSAFNDFCYRIFLKCLNLTKCSVWDDVQKATTDTPKLWKNSEKSVRKKRILNISPNIAIRTTLIKSNKFSKSLILLLLRFPPYSSCVQVFFYCPFLCPVAPFQKSNLELIYHMSPQPAQNHKYVFL